jgi:hypothetical protein
MIAGLKQVLLPTAFLFRGLRHVRAARATLPSLLPDTHALWPVAVALSPDVARPFWLGPAT